VGSVGGTFQPKSASKKHERFMLFKQDVFKFQANFYFYTTNCFIIKTNYGTFRANFMFSAKIPAMPTVKFTYALKRFFPALNDVHIEGQTLHELLRKIDQRYPGLQAYIVDEAGALRKHVNIFIDGALIKDRQRLGDAFGENSEVYIMQALSGG
jgi:hypothetical protein